MNQALHLIQEWFLCDEQGFVRERGRQIILEGRSPSELLDKLETYSAGEPLVTILARENEARRANGTPKS